ncbi:MAG: hypothetical protein ACE5JF_12200 [Anaerolineales bacterium]
MNPTVMKMLTDAHMKELNRQVEQQRSEEQTSSQGHRATLPMLWIALFMAVVVSSIWLV